MQESVGGCCACREKKSWKGEILTSAPSANPRPPFSLYIEFFLLDHFLIFYRTSQSDSLHVLLAFVSPAESILDLPAVVRPSRSLE